MESVSEEILREILLKLPTRGVARCRCVCSRWRRLLTDPAFLALHGHAAHVVAGAGGAETLLVSKTNSAPGMNPETVLFNLSTTTPMCHFADLDVEVYSPANACNAFLCLVSEIPSAPVVVCNPVTGEKLRIPAPPEVESISVVDWHFWAMGFAPSTGQYKIFRVSFPEYYWEAVHLDVYTFGDNAGWQGHRQHLDSIYRTMCSLPVLIKGMVYVVTGSGRTPDTLLAIDVASEMVYTHRLPKQRRKVKKTAVDALELHGRLCLAMHELDVPRPKLTFWELTIDLRVPRSQIKHYEDNDDFSWFILEKDDDDWELCYSFCMDGHDCSDIHCYHRCECHPRGAWLHDGDGVLCYLSGGRLYKYDTTVKQGWQYSSFPVRNKEWDHRIWLPPPSHSWWWNIYGGYRPSLVSPRRLATSSSFLQHHHELPFEHPLLRAMRCGTPSKKRCLSDNGTNHQQAVKRRPTLSFLDDC
ncbi:unnamed protein product [Alopecurus aequalis]